MIDATTIFGSLFPTTVIAIVVGIVAVAVQQRRQQQRKAMGEFERKKRNGGHHPSPSDTESLLRQHIREVHEFVQVRNQWQSLEVLSQELKNMKKMQSDVKDMLEGLRKLVEEASEKTNTIAPS